MLGCVPVPPRTLIAVRFATTTQLTRLLAAVPHLQTLNCVGVFCYQKSPSVTPLPVYRVALRELRLWGRLDSALFDLLLRTVEHQGELRNCGFATSFDMPSALGVQRLLKACSETLGYLHLTLVGGFDESPEEICMSCGPY